jgi:hypothetical protein
MLIFIFLDFGQIMDIEPMDHRCSKLGSMGFFNISHYAVSTSEYHYEVYLSFGI